MFFPAYNERENIVKLVSDAKRVLSEVANDYEVIVVVYEGSTDGTIDVVRSLEDSHVKLVIQPLSKKGVGYANIMGFDVAKYEYVFYADSDNQFDLQEFKKFLPFLNYDIVAGYRIDRKDPFLRIFTSKVYNFIVKLVFGAKERDVDCAFRLVNRRVFSKVRLNCRLGLGTTELLVKARRAGFRIKEVGVHHYARLKGSSVFESEGINLPKPKVVFDLIKEMKVLWKDLKR
jgi:glycosyltransferase involved in cell wall biosynthesis